MITLVPATLLTILAATSASTSPARPFSLPSSLRWIPAVEAPAVPTDGLRRSVSLAAANGPASQTAPAPVAIEYSHGYQVRARVHKMASFAILPLFATEAWLGQSIYNNPTPGKRNAHVAVGAAIGGLFAVNTVTGVWNLVEARNDPNGRGRRRLHAILMLAADAGFLATAMLAPEDDGEGSNTRGAHRTMAVVSISTATVGYLTMLFGGR